MDKSTNTLITAEEARLHYSYDPETGDLHRLTGRYAGLCDKTDRNGYHYVHFGRRQYRSHRLIWLIVHGEWPADQIDHLNGNPGDNRLRNLRLATSAENIRNRGVFKNNKLGIKGVCIVRGRPWAQLMRDGKFVLRESFDTVEEAAHAYRMASLEYHGRFARPN